MLVAVVTVRSKRTTGPASSNEDGSASAPAMAPVRRSKDTSPRLVSAMHVVTPGVDTDMLDATEEVFGRYIDTSSWEKVTPAEWAAKVINAVEADDDILGPGGKTAWAKLASRGPGFLLDAASKRMFSRQPRR